MRYQLKFKDGSVLNGKIVGEMGSSLLFRDDRSSEGIRVVHISELSAAWKVRKSDVDEIPAKKAPVVTYKDEFRILGIDEVDDLTREEDLLPTRYPLPDVYYEVEKIEKELVFSCENTGLDREDVEVYLSEGRMDIYMIGKQGPRQVAVKLDRSYSRDPEIKVTENMIEIRLY